MISLTHFMKLIEPSYLATGMANYPPGRPRLHYHRGYLPKDLLVDQAIHSSPPRPQICQNPHYKGC